MKFSISTANYLEIISTELQAGDKAYKKDEKELEKEIEKEEEQVAKIRQLAKSRNKGRNQLKAPPPKRRRTEEGYENTTTNQNQSETEKTEKRNQETQEHGPHAKKRKEDIRELFKRQEMATDIIIEPEQENDNNIFYGEEETVEIVNWEEIFKKHQEETSRLDREE